MIHDPNFKHAITYFDVQGNIVEKRHFFEALGCYVFENTQAS